MPTLQDLRTSIPELNGLDDTTAVEYIRRVHYPDRTAEEIGSRLGIKPVAPSGSSGLVRRVVGDTGVSLLRGAVAVPEAAVGLADIVTGGRVGKFLENEGGSIGFRPKQAKEIIGEIYSPEQKAANMAVQEADGFTGKFAAAVQNPSVVAQAAAESLPAMFGGGVLARGVMKLAPKMSGFAAAGIGEGIVAAGAGAEQMRQETDNGLLTAGQAGIAAASGAATGALGVLAGKAAKSLGIGDIDTLIATGGKGTAEVAQKGLARKIVEGAATEGLLEELPQSVQQQVAQNYALGKPLSEGVDYAAVLGLLTGMTMGGAAASFTGGPLERGAAVAQAPAAPAAPPLAIGNTPDPLINFPDGTTARRGEVEAYIASLPTEGQRMQARAKFMGINPQAMGGTVPPAPVRPVPATNAPGLTAQQEQQALTSLDAVAAGDQKSMRTFAREGVVPMQPQQPAEVIGPEPTPRPLPPAFEPDLNTPNAIAEALDEINQRNDQTRKLYTPQPGDRLNKQGEPFSNKAAANIDRKKAGEGFEVVPAGKGFVVRPAEQAPMLALPAPKPTPAAMPPADADLPTLKKAWREAAAAGRTEDAKVINDRIVAAKNQPQPTYLGNSPDAAPVQKTPVSLADAPAPVQKGPESMQVAAGKDVMPAGLNVTFGGKSYPVESVEDAQRKWIKFQESADGGSPAGVSQVGNGVPITDGAGRLVARVAYNGRAFDPDDNLLAEPPAAEQPAPAPAAPVARPNRRTKAVEAKAKEAEAQRADYFTPGNIVKGYGGFDEVLRYDAPDASGRWNVRVRRVVKQGDEWVPAQEGGRPADPRNHSTRPDDKELKAGPVRRAPAQEQANAPVQPPGTNETTARPAAPTTEAQAPAGTGTATTASVPGTATSAADEAAGVEPAATKPPEQQTETEFGAALQAKAITEAEQELKQAKAGEYSAIRFKSKAAAVRAAEANLKDAKESRPEQFAGDHLGAINKAIAAGRMPSAENIKRYDIPAEQLQFAASRSAKPSSAADAKPAAPLYASRPLTPASAEAIRAWAASQGFKTTLPADDMHVTVAYSREPVDGATVPADAKALTVPAGKRTVEPLGDQGAVVLKFDSPALQARWKQYRDAGASWDYESYNPHVTLTYDGAGVDLKAVEPYTGPIELAAETQEPLNVDKADDYKEAGEDPTPQAAADKPAAEVQAPAESIIEEAQALPPAEPETPTESAPAETAAQEAAEAERIADFGEKIGGARKDTARATGPRMVRDQDERPKWARKYLAAEKTDRAGNKTGKWGLFTVKDQFMSPATRQDFATEQAALDAIPMAEVALRHRVYSYSDGGKMLFGIYRRLGERKRALVKGGFATEDAAMLALALDPVSVIEHKFEFPERPWLDNIERIGPPRRTGDVTPTMFETTFGFRGGEFGNWNQGGDGQETLNHAYEGLMDLADAIGVPPKALSLNGELAIAFGARGKGGKNAGAAHYERDYGVINLTKKQGAGSLAHEFFHALDHYLGRQDGKSSSVKAPNERGDLVYQTGKQDRSPDYVTYGFSRKSKAREELRAAFNGVMDAITGKPRQVPVDPKPLERTLERERQSLDYYLNDLRSSLTNGAYNRNKKTATPEQLKQWDALTEKIRAGDVGAPQYIGPNGPIAEDQKAGYRYSAARKSAGNIIAANAIYKAVTGRSFDKSGYDSRGNQILVTAQGIALRADQLKEATGRADRGETYTQTITTDYAINARDIDSNRASPYWATPHEMGARAFEAFILDRIAERAQRSDYLVYGAENSFYEAYGMKPYPEGDERKAIDAAFGKLFDTIQTRTDDAGNVALYEPAADGYTANDGQPDADRAREPESPGSPAGSAPASTGRPAEPGTAANVPVRGAGVAVSSRPRITALGIAADIQRAGSAALVGQVADTPEKLAELAQVYRDPRYETFRVFFTAAGKIVHSTGVSARLPGITPMIPDGVSDADYFQQFRDQMAATGADGYYVLHNHPSGDPTPSPSDVSLTARLAMQVPGMRAHVVINSNRYAVITPRKGEQVKVKDFGPDLLLQASKPSPVLGKEIANPDALVALGKGLQRAGYVTLIGTSGAGNKVRVVADAPADILRRPPIVLAAIVRRLMRQSGAGNMHLVGSSADIANRSVVKALQNGILRDAVSEMDRSSADAGLGGNQGGFDRTPGRNMAEPTASYSRNMGETLREAVPSGKMTAQDLLNAKGGIFTRAGETKSDLARAAVEGSRPFWLGAMTRDQIADMYGTEIPPVKDYDNLTRQMENERQGAAQKAEELYEEWSKIDAEANDKLARVMLDATVAQVHPDQADPPAKATAEQRSAHAMLRAQYRLLPKDAQAMYAKVRDFHAGTLADLRKALEGRIERLIDNGAERAVALADIRKRFDQYMQGGPYFPLHRFGDFLVIANRESDGERVVAAYENAGEQAAAARALEADGFSVKLQMAKKYNRAMDGSAGKFIGDVLQAIDKMDMKDSRIGDSPTSMKAQLLDDLNQLFIKALPDLSYRKHFTHRKNTAGFSADVMRGFASSAFHAAGHIARLNHGDKMTFALEDAYKQIENAPEGDFTKHSQILGELAKRHDVALNPNTSPLSAAATQVGFVMYLGLSPAAGLINMLQVPMVALPYIGARYGFTRATAAMGKAYTDIMGAKANAKSGFNAAQSPKLSADERQAISTLQEEGVIDLTQAHDLASATSRDVGNQARSKASFAIARAMRIVGWTFHVPEVMNRQVTALMAYRLEMGKSANQEKAMEAAREAIKRSQFDYSSSNRARYMQGNVMRVVTQFKQFSQNMTYFLGRAAYQALKDESPEVRRIARNQLLSTFMVTGAMAGSLGLPGVTFFAGLVQGLVNAMGGDDDEPWDWKTEYRNMLADTFGKEWGEVMARGVPRALMPAWDISGRVSLSDLWWRDGGREGENPREAFANDMGNILGPTAGTILGWYTAADHMGRGDYAKAVEAVVPKFIRDPLKAAREAQGGITSYTGEPLMDVTAAEIVGRFSGFAPARASEMFEGRNAVMNAKTALDERRQRLVSQMAKARIDGDTETVDGLRERIASWNRANPQMKITTATIAQSMRARRRNADNTEQGITLPASKDFLRERARFAEVG